MPLGLISKTGTIGSIFFRRIGFSAGIIYYKNGESDKFAGNLFAKEKRKLTICGKYERSKYGKQFNVYYVKPEIYIDLDGLAKYLAICPDIKGVGLHKAKRIINNVGLKFEEFLFKNPEKIIEVANLTKNSLKKIQINWEPSRGWNQIYSWLASFDLSYFQIQSIVQSLGCEAPFLLKEDPYTLIDKIKGISFLKIDKIALKLGFDKKFPGRLLGALKDIVYIQLKKGHCWTEREELQKSVVEFLDLNKNEDKDDILDTIAENISNKIFHSHLIKSSKIIAIGLSKIAIYEKELAKFFATQDANPHLHFFKEITSFNINSYDELILNKMQLAAITSALKHNISIISGGAGTGKTYTIKIITKIYKSKKLLVKMAASTGKAARRIEEITGIKASTLHRLMGYDGHCFEHEKTNFKILADIIIVDEVSMIDVELFWHLFKSLDLTKTCLVLVGDHNQLPPVGPGNILRDLMSSEIVAITVLDEIMRHAGTLKENSSAILQSKINKSIIGLQKSWYVEDYHYNPLKLKKYVLEMFNRRFEDLGFHILYDVQILSPTHKGPLGTLQLNIDIRRVIQKKLFDLDIPGISEEEHKNITNLRFYKHDKVIQTVNDYKNDIMNGEVGFVTNVNKNKSISIIFNGHKKPIIFKYNSKAIYNIHLAYCLSIHKVQGSQFPCVVSIIHRSHSFMHHRNLLYTAVTRAEKTAIIIGDSWGIKNCVNKAETEKRRTFLKLYFAS